MDYFSDIIDVIYPSEWHFDGKVGAYQRMEGFITERYGDCSGLPAVEALLNQIRNWRRQAERYREMLKDAREILENQPYDL